MPRTIGKAGRSVRRMELHHVRVRLLSAIITVLAMALLYRLYSHVGLKVKGTAALVLVGAFLAILKTVEALAGEADARHRKRERNAGRGAAGEEKIAAVLGGLSDEYVVIHDLECPNGNIDHVVIGPNGVFQIETKAHGGKVAVEGDTLLVNGKRPEKDFIRQAQRNSIWLKEQIRAKTGVDLYVIALLVFANAFTSGARQLSGVRVSNVRFLASELARPGRTPVPVDRVAEALTDAGGLKPQGTQPDP